MRSPLTLTRLTALATLLAGCADAASSDPAPPISVRGALVPQADPPQPDKVLRLDDFEAAEPPSEDAVRTIEPRVDDAEGGKFADEAEGKFAGEAEGKFANESEGKFAGAGVCPDGAKYVDAKYCDVARYAKY